MRPAESAGTALRCRGAIPLHRAGGLPAELPPAHQRRRTGEGAGAWPLLRCQALLGAWCCQACVVPCTSASSRTQRPLPPSPLQSATARGSRVTVLANATEVFGNIDQSMPKFDQWLHDAMGINASDMLQARAPAGIAGRRACVCRWGHCH